MPIFEVPRVYIVDLAALPEILTCILASSQLLNQFLFLFFCLHFLVNHPFSKNAVPVDNNRFRIVFFAAAPIVDGRQFGKGDVLALNQMRENILVPREVMIALERGVRPLFDEGRVPLKLDHSRIVERFVDISGERDAGSAITVGIESF